MSNHPRKISLKTMTTTTKLYAHFRSLSGRNYSLEKKKHTQHIPDD